METERVSQLKQMAASLLTQLQEFEQQKGMSPESALSKPTVHDLELNSLRAQLAQVLDVDVQQACEKMETDLQAAITDFKGEMKDVESEIKRALGSADSTADMDRPCYFSQKVHKIRGPLLIRMCNSPDIRTIYHIFIAIMAVMSIGEVGKSYLTKGEVIDLSLFVWAFGKFHYVVPFWGLMLGWSMLVIPIVQCISKGYVGRRIWIPVYILYLALNYVGSSVFAIYMELPMASGFVVTCEMARLFMKSHSYMREKLMFGMGPNAHADFIPEKLLKRGITKDQLSFPTITIENMTIEARRYLYFAFAPTLVYRDSYPRIPGVRRWKSVFYNLLNVLGTIIYTFIIFVTFCIPHFHECWHKQWDGSIFTVSVFKSMLPGTMLLLLMFFGILHSWQNLWGEIMMFGDRKFYEDWWNVHNFADYYRKWNMTVHEWLHQYVYQDLIRFTKGKVSQFGALCVVFAFSAFFHELILAVTMQFVYPLLFILFGGPGVLYVYLTRSKNRAYNIFVWSMFFIGNGLLVIFYTWEFYARQFIDLKPQYGWKAVFIPHSWQATLAN